MNKIIVLFAITLSGLLLSCATDRLEDQTLPNIENKKNVVTSLTYKSNIYATGFERIWSINPNQKNTATVWLNGVATALTDGTHTATGNSVVADNNNVYVAGNEHNGSKYVAKLWVNGAVNNLTDGTANASSNSVFLYNGNVYVGGYDGNDGKIWRLNGVTQTFEPVGLNAVVRITSVFIYNSDVYACGFEMSESGVNPNHKVWKNGILMSSLSGNTNNTIAKSIFVSSGDVYVAGREGNTAVVWKNGVSTYLSNGTYNAMAESVYVSGSNVYVAGYDYTGVGRLAKLWKNGVANNLTTDINGDAYASSVHVKNLNAFIGGTVRNPSFSNVPNVATVWKYKAPGFQATQAYTGITTSYWSTQNYQHAIYSIYVK